MATPIGHSLAGYAIYKALEPYAPRNRVWLAVFMAIAPDLDFIPGLLRGAPAFYHQGITHSIGFALAISAALALIFGRNRQHWYWLFSLCFLAFLSHLIIDFFGPDGRPPYGQPLLWPMSDTHILSPISMFWGMHHAGGTHGSVSDWLEGIFSLYNLRAIAVEVALLSPLLLLKQLCGQIVRR